MTAAAASAEAGSAAEQQQIVATALGVAAVTAAAQNARGTFLFPSNFDELEKDIFFRRVMN